MSPPDEPELSLVPGGGRFGEAPACVNSACAGRGVHCFRRSGKYLRSGLTSYPVQSDCRPEITGRRQIGMPPEMKWSHENGTHEDQPRHRPQRRARRPGPRPGTRYRARRRQPGSGRSRRAGGQPRQRRRRHRRRRRDRQARRPRRAARDGEGRHRHPGQGRQARHPRHLDPRRPGAGRHRPQARKTGRPASPATAPPAARTVPRDDETAGEAGQDGTAETASPAPAGRRRRGRHRRRA